MPALLPRPSVVVDHDETREAMWRFSIIGPIREATAPGSPERAEAIAARAATPATDWQGQRRELAERTIRRWITRYDADGLAGLMRKAPANAGQRRVCLSREWDAVVQAAGLDEDAIEALVDRIRRRVRGEWTNGTPGWPTVQLNVTPFAVKLTREAGVDLPASALASICTIPRRFIEAERHYQAVAIAEKDAARFAADFVPRIKRDRSHLRPGDWVAGDVHHIDILFRCTDGRIVTPKAVAWLDLATNRTWLDIFIMPAGEMIRREHVIQSFVAMCQDRNWGVPSRLYVDNGGEYNWADLAGDLAQLKHKVELRFDGVGQAIDAEPIKARAGVHRSKAYTPQSKVIETLFSTMEGMAFAQLPGWIGGNRMRKKTANQGREPDPFPGDEAALRKAVATAIGYYHVKPQEGHLAGASPNGRFAGFVADGWTATTIDAAELAVAFSIQHVKPVRTGGTIRLDKVDYRSEALVALPGLKQVLVREPLFGDRSTLFVFHTTGEFLGTATPDMAYRFGDPAGAAAQRERHKVLHRKVKTLASEADREAGGLGAMAEVVQLYGASPDAADPEATIRINPEFTAAARSVRNAPARAAEEADRRHAQRERKSSFLARLAAGGG